MKQYPFTDEEVRLMRAGSARHLSLTTIADNLNVLPSNLGRGIARTMRSVRQKLFKMGVVRRAPGLVPAMEGSARVCDDAFQQVLAAAIKSGLERCVPGIKKDDTPFVGRFIQAEPSFSGCSSSGAMCADLVAADGIGTGAI